MPRHPDGVAPKAVHRQFTQIVLLICRGFPCPTTSRLATWLTSLVSTSPGLVMPAWPGKQTLVLGEFSSMNACGTGGPQNASAQPVLMRMPLCKRPEQPRSSGWTGCLGKQTASLAESHDLARASSPRGPPAPAGWAWCRMSLCFRGFGCTQSAPLPCWMTRAYPAYHGWAGLTGNIACAAIAVALSEGTLTSSILRNGEVMVVAASSSKGGRRSGVLYGVPMALNEPVH